LTSVTLSQPIGNGTTNFTGIFDGNGHTISNFTYSDSVSGYIGLFGVVSGNGTTGGLIQNLVLSNVNVTGTSGGYTATLVGSLSGGAVTNCSASGTVNGTNGNFGGLIGSVSGNV